MIRSTIVTLVVCCFGSAACAKQSPTTTTPGNDEAYVEKNTGKDDTEEVAKDPNPIDVTCQAETADYPAPYTLRDETLEVMGYKGHTLSEEKLDEARRYYQVVVDVASKCVECAPGDIPDLRKPDDLFGSMTIG